VIEKARANLSTCFSASTVRELLDLFADAAALDDVSVPAFMNLLVKMD
jgi:hypothetical protein